MTKSDVEKLLGRPLTPIEDANFALYLQIAQQSIQNFLCFDPIADDLDDGEVRAFKAREGYSTVFVGIFEDLERVKVNGHEVENYTPQLWDNLNTGVYNSIVFDRPLRGCDVVEITADWGFSKIPADLQLVIARAFALITKQNKFDPTIKHKRVEDFDITIDNTVDLDDAFYQQNEATLTAYSLCGVGNIQHGSVCRW